ncbi:Gfo/Idh/MocA family protein [Paenibacillus sp. HJGM_3]|uniref:Gfo/Idh/MocA family protein n=1 Tax=Paenibacillus sp. HJGM_3 TaxID=3379816 RepID=UPI00385A8E77
MKVAVVGSGGMGRIHAHAYTRMAGVELVGVCDIEFALAEELARNTNSRAFPSFEALVEAVSPEAVSLTLPSHLHKEYAIKAAERGIHVISEKPISLSLEDAEAVIQSCEKHGVKLFVGHVVRFFPDYVQMKNAVEAGKLGTIGVAHFKRIGGHPGNVRPWFKEEDKSGGVIVDLMVHDIDFARWTFGEVKSVYCMKHTDNNMDYALATLVFESGAVANLEAYWGYPGAFRTAAEIAGSNGVVRADSATSSSLQVRKAAVDGEAGRFVEVPQSPSIHSPYYIELQHFIDCIRGNAEPVVTGRDAYKALEIANAARESARTGRAVLLGGAVG